MAQANLQGRPYYSRPSHSSISPPSSCAGSSELAGRARGPIVAHRLARFAFLPQFHASLLAGPDHEWHALRPTHHRAQFFVGCPLGRQTVSTSSAPAEPSTSPSGRRLVLGLMITGLGFVPVAADFVFGFGFVFALVFIFVFVLVSGSTFQLAPAWFRRPCLACLVIYIALSLA